MSDAGLTLQQKILDPVLKGKSYSFRLNNTAAQFSTLGRQLNPHIDRFSEEKKDDLELEEHLKLNGNIHTIKINEDEEEKGNYSYVQVKTETFLP